MWLTTLSSKENQKIQLFENILKDLDLVSNYNIVSFDNKKILYKIIYNGSPNQFLTEPGNPLFKIVAFDTTGIGVPADVIINGGENGVGLWTIDISIPPTQDGIENVTKQHVFDFINSLGCFQNNTLATLNMNAI